MQWIEVTIKTTSAAIDLVCDRLTVLGFDSFIIDDQQDFERFLEENHQYWDYVDEDLEQKMQGLSQIRLYLEETAGVMDEVAALRQALAHWRTRCPVDPGTLEITCATMQNEDWENNWKQYYQPIAIGERLLVVPQWLTPENPAHRVEVRLDPGMIFGTGAHASTQMCRHWSRRCAAASGSSTWAAAAASSPSRRCCWGRPAPPVSISTRRRRTSPGTTPL